jgi:hypothetical protein
VKPLEKQYFTETREYLCKILAHYMVFLGTKLKLPIAEATEKHIMMAAHKRWEKEGKFSWGSSIDGILEEEEDDRQLHDCDLPSDPKPDTFPAVHQAQISGEDFGYAAEDLTNTLAFIGSMTSELSAPIEGAHSWVNNTDFDYWHSFVADGLATDSPSLTTMWQHSLSTCTASHRKCRRHDKFICAIEYCREDARSAARKLSSWRQQTQVLPLGRLLAGGSSMNCY